MTTGRAGVPAQHMGGRSTPTTYQASSNGCTTADYLLQSPLLPPRLWRKKFVHKKTNKTRFENEQRKTRSENEDPHSHNKCSCSHQLRQPSAARSDCRIRVVIEERVAASLFFLICRATILRCNRGKPLKTFTKLK